jgi:predicted porin
MLPRQAFKVQLIRVFSNFTLHCSTDHCPISLFKEQHMKKSLLALAVLGAVAGFAQAESAVVIYGTLDAGVSKISNNKTKANAVTTTTLGRRDNNKLGFKGTEDLGNGLNALFQLEMRYDPDTGTVEAGSRPLFQGQSRVGLSGAFGMVRLGRGLTAFQETSTQFEPWSGVPSVAGFQTDLTVAGYTSDPLSAAGNSANRFSNAVFYNSPEMGGFQVNTTVGTKENNGGPAVALATPGKLQFPVGASASKVPYSVSATFKQPIFALMAAYERNAVDTNLWSVGATVTPIQDLKLLASYTRQDQSKTVISAFDKTKSWVVGANYTMGPGKFMVGYGQKNPDGELKTKQASLGYEYSLSKRTYVYADLSQRRSANVQTANTSDTASTSFYGVGVHHNF